MKRLLLLLLLGVIPRLAKTDPLHAVITGDQRSPGSGILVQHYRDEDKGTEQIWLVSTADPSRRHLLFTHDRSAAVVFSPDEKWLVINNHGGSSESSLLLYRRTAPLEYEQAADLTAGAWKFFDQQNGRPARFDHSYIEALRWADDDPPTVLLALTGHLDSHNHISEWYCFYDVQTKIFDTDLAAHNKKVTVIAPARTGR